MKCGVSFCGVDIETLGLEYVPDKKETYVFKSASSSIEEESFNGHDGGYYYGSTLKPKDFSLLCYYEETDIRNGIMSKVQALFKTGRTGKLVFSIRPWCYYIATVISVDTSSMLNFRNGLITITLRAYYPFARTDFTQISEWDLDRFDVMKNSGYILKEGREPDAPVVGSEDSRFLVYNPGTVTADAFIEIAGDVDEGVIIKNTTNGTECEIVALSKAVTSDENKYLIIDSLSGKTVLTDGETGEIAFLYHDHGFITLEPAFPIIRDVLTHVDSGSTTVQFEAGSGVSDVVGKYVYVGTWKKIVSEGEDTVEIEAAVDETFDDYTEIVSMNELVVEPVSTMDITRFNITFYPTFN